MWQMLVLLIISTSHLSALIEKELLITGCARSGTTYISHLFKVAGVDLSHDHDGDMGLYGISSWLLVSDAEKAPWGPCRKNYSFQRIFHQVRNPLKVISSVYTTEPSISWEFIINNIPEISWDDSHTIKCAKYWYYWNLKAEKIAEWTYRIEDIDRIWSEFARCLNLFLDPVALTLVPKDTNTRGALNRSFTWEELEQELDPDLFEKVLLLALRYGYIIDEQD